MKGVIRFEMKSKLVSKYIGLFEVLQNVGNVFYKLDLSASTKKNPFDFHVSMLRKFKSNSGRFLVSLM